MATAAFTPNPAQARTPKRTAWPPYPPLPRTRRPLIFWPAAVAAAVGSLLFVAALFAVIPHRRHAAPAAPTETASLVPVAAEPAPVEAPPAPEQQASALPAPEQQATAPPAPEQQVSAPLMPEQQASAPPPNPPEVADSPVLSLAKAASEKATTCPQYGTAVNFYDSPTEASKKALQEEKLVFVLHVAGNFEEPGFT
jgi:hypothetical protein